MSKFKFKTDINCNGCVSSVTPYLEKVPNLSDWSVAIDKKDKILRVEGEGLKKEEVIQAVKDAGFSIEEKKGLSLFS